MDYFELECAVEEWAQRTGKMINGQFVKNDNNS